VFPGTFTGGASDGDVIGYCRAVLEGASMGPAPDELTREWWNARNTALGLAGVWVPPVRRGLA
jgi:hypothetical protein